MEWHSRRVRPGLSPLITCLGAVSVLPTSLVFTLFIHGFNVQPQRMQSVQVNICALIYLADHSIISMHLLQLTFMPGFTQPSIDLRLVVANARIGPAPIQFYSEPLPTKYINPNALYFK